MTITFEIILLVTAFIVSFFCPFIRWDIFAESTTLIRFNNHIVILFSVLLFLSLVKWLSKKEIKLVSNLASLIITLVIIYQITSPANFTGTTAEGSVVTAIKMYGFYITLVISIIYLVVISLNTINNLKLKENKER